MGEKLVIARIMYGGLIHRQGLLKVGDVVKEVNGEVVSSMQPVELQTMLVRRRLAFTHI
jgi:C-terminal processing protease CtpA/Prc